MVHPPGSIASIVSESFDHDDAQFFEEEEEIEFTFEELQDRHTTINMAISQPSLSSSQSQRRNTTTTTTTTTNNNTSVAAPSIPNSPISTPLTSLLRIQHPILLAGMAHTSTARLAAAVTNAGGLGVIGGLSYTPTQLREMIHEMKEYFTDQTSAKFGIDLALPSLGPTARKTNHDYTHGHLDALIDVIIEEGASLFVSAVGIPPAHVIEKLHGAGILIMNMIGHPKHAVKALDAGVDILCAQGGEGGGHTGDIASSILIPAVLDVVNTGKWRSKMTGEKPLVVAAGGVYDGRGLAAALVQGCAGVWVGTRFVASEEAGCSRAHKQGVVTATFEDTIRTLVVSGRPLRVRRNEYVAAWEARPEEIRRLTESGVVPLQKDMEEGNEFDIPHLMGQVAAVIGEVKPARVIVDEMIGEAVERLRMGFTLTGEQGGGRRDSKL